MEIRKLFRLVHFLTDDQVRNFKNFMKGRDKSKDWLLFVRILEHSDYQKSIEKLIRGEEFSDSSGYYVYRRRLAQFLIQSLVTSERKSPESLEFVKAAYLSEMNEVGGKILETKMLKLQENEDFTGLQACFDLIDELKDFYSIVVDLPASITPKNVHSRFRSNNRNLWYLIEEIRSGLKLNPTERHDHANFVLNSIPEQDRTDINKILRLKVLGGVSLLKGQFARSLSLGAELVSRIQNTPIDLPSIFLAKELQLLALQAALLDERDLAIKYCMQISAVEAKSLFEETAIRSYTIKIAAYLAERYGSEDVCELAISQLTKNQDIFCPKMQRTLFFTLALAYYYDRKWSKSISSLIKLQQINSTDSEDLIWEPLVLLAICHYESGDPDLSESILKSAQRQATKANGLYPRMAIKSIVRVHNSSPLARKSVLENEIKGLEALLLDPIENRASLCFSAVGYLKGKLTNASPRKFTRKAAPIINSLPTKLAQIS